MTTADRLTPTNWSEGSRLISFSIVQRIGRVIDDIVDQIPIGADREAPGNLDRAKVYGIDWTNSFNFAPLGWKGAKLDLRAAAA